MSLVLNLVKHEDKWCLTFPVCDFDGKLSFVHTHKQLQDPERKSGLELLADILFDVQNSLRTKDNKLVRST